MSSETALAQAVAQLAEARPGCDGVAELLVEQLVSVLPVRHAGVILVGRDGAPVVAAASTATVEHVESAEVRSGEGPGLQTMRTGQPVTCVIGSKTPWLGYAAAAAWGGYSTVHSLPIRQGNHTIGAAELLYEKTEGDPGQAHEARALIAVAASRIAHDRDIAARDQTVGQLQAALNSRVIIEQAKGTIAARRGVSIDEAFALLRRYARNHNQKLYDLAHAIICGHLEISAPSPLGRGPHRGS